MKSKPLAFILSAAAFPLLAWLIMARSLRDAVAIAALSLTTLAAFQIAVGAAGNNAIDQVPGLSNLPVLGALFRSVNWQRQQTELVIIVTPHLTAPSDHIESLPTPLLATDEPSPIDLILLGMIDQPATPAAKTRHP